MSSHLKRDKGGMIHVGSTGAFLDDLIEAHQKGDSKESILARHPGLTKDELEAAMEYHLAHTSDTPPRGPEQRDANWRRWNATLAEDLGTDTLPNMPIGQTQ